MMVYVQPILATLFGFLALMLMGVILLQRGRGVGLAGAFGGMGGQSAFGSKTGDVLTWATVWIAVAFLAFTLILNYVFVPQKMSVAPAPTPPPISTPGPADSPPLEVPTPVDPIPIVPTPADSGAAPAPSETGAGTDAPPTDPPADPGAGAETP